MAVLQEKNSCMTQKEKRAGLGDSRASGRSRPQKPQIDIKRKIIRRCLFTFLLITGLLTPFFPLEYIMVPIFEAQI